MRGRGGRLSWDDFSARWTSLHGGFEIGGSQAVVGGWMRLSFVTGRLLVRLRVRPGTVTAIGLVLSLAVPVLVLFHGVWLLVAALLVFASALADSTDGAVAIMSDRTSRLGSFYDSLADRVSEAAWLVALWLAGAPGLLVAACGALAWLHEYARARAALSGMPGVGAVTVAERPTRVMLVIAALVVGGLVWLINARLTPGLVTVVVAVWLVLGLLGASRLHTAIRAALR